jgi:hypothetical protein
MFHAIPTRIGPSGPISLLPWADLLGPRLPGHLWSFITMNGSDLPMTKYKNKANPQPTLSIPSRTIQNRSGGGRRPAPGPWRRSEPCPQRGIRPRATAAGASHLRLNRSHPRPGLWGRAHAWRAATRAHLYGGGAGGAAPALACARRRWAARPRRSARRHARAWCCAPGPCRRRFRAPRPLLRPTAAGGMADRPAAATAGPRVCRAELQRRCSVAASAGPHPRSPAVWAAPRGSGASRSRRPADRLSRAAGPACPWVGAYSSSGRWLPDCSSSGRRQVRHFRPLNGERRQGLPCIAQVVSGGGR